MTPAALQHSFSMSVLKPNPLMNHKMQPQRKNAWCMHLAICLFVFLGGGGLKCDERSGIWTSMNKAFHSMILSFFGADSKKFQCMQGERHARKSRERRLYSTHLSIIQPSCPFITPTHLFGPLLNSTRSKRSDLAVLIHLFPWCKTVALKMKLSTKNVLIKLRNLRDLKTLKTQPADVWHFCQKNLPTIKTLVKLVINTLKGGQGPLYFYNVCIEKESTGKFAFCVTPLCVYQEQLQKVSLNLKECCFEVP